METRKINIIFTTDVHGNYFPYDFKHDHWGKGSLQRVHAFVAQQVKRLSGSTILIDGGDLLQGDPTSYYFNCLCRPNDEDFPMNITIPSKESFTRHKVSEMCNFIGYDVGVIGNHDIETGHDVYDQFVHDCNFPILGANAISDETGEPYFEPYTILYRSGIRIAVIGFITPAIPHWVPRRVWEGMHFEDIKESARYWVQFVKEHEQPDFIIGLFHSGMDEGIITPEYHENATRETVENVDGFDLVLYGHDHASHMEEIESPCGKSVLCVNPGSYAFSVAEIRLKFHVDSEGKVGKHDITSQISYIGTLNNTHSSEFKRHFRHEFQMVKDFVQHKIGSFASGVDITDAYFGSSAYIDFLQQLQLQVSGADISFCAPLFFNASIQAGEVKIADLFNLYRFEDRLYILQLTGQEIKDYLEMSYANWTGVMKSKDDNMLLLSPMKSNPERIGFTNFIFNFDSAAGIRYEVDLRRQQGEKINILSMADGTPFQYDRFYKVCMTAYRANGGGELLTKGAGLTKEEIERRIQEITSNDVRHYMMDFINKEKTVTPTALHHWRFIPEDWAKAAEVRERQLLFGSK